MKLLTDFPMKQKSKIIKILCVDSDVPSQELMKAYCDTLGYEVSTFKSNKDAIKELKKNRYDICFMDFSMPLKGDNKAILTIRQEICKDLPVIAITTSTLQGSRERALDSGMSDYLSKPIDLDDIKQKVDQHVNGTS